MITPLTLTILVDVVCRAEVSNITAPAVREETDRLMRDGILVLVGDGVYGLTDKGNAWFRLIRSTPYPKHQWIDAQGKVIPE